MTRPARRLATLALAGLLLAAPLSASAQRQRPIDPVGPRERPNPAPGYVGSWAADPTWCGNDPATTDQLRVMITTGAFGGLETSCPFADVLPTPGGSS